jgi:hypothetical protein
MTSKTVRLSHLLKSLPWKQQKVHGHDDRMVAQDRSKRAPYVSLNQSHGNLSVLAKRSSSKIPSSLFSLARQVVGLKTVLSALLMFH